MQLRTLSGGQLARDLGGVHQRGKRLHERRLSGFAGYGCQLSRLLNMGRKFHAHVNPPWPFDEAAFLRTIETLRQTGYVAEARGGFIAGVVMGNPISPGWIMAKEFLWWSEDGSGLKLRNGFRAWAIERGANEIQWSCPPSSRANRIFARSGQATEIVYSEYPPCALAP